MEMGGQPHVPVSESPRKEPPATNDKMGGAQS